MLSNCTPPPSNLPKEWAGFIHPNCYKNIERLGKWVGRTSVVKANESPAPYFETVKPDSIGANATSGVNLYVVTHGWAPGLREAVDKAEGKLQWWGADAITTQKKDSDKKEWASNWAWTGTTGEKHHLKVSPTGLLQQIEKFEAQRNNGKETVVLAYSWVDDSATPPVGPKNLFDASRSEAYTNLNGLRLAAAINDATAHGFFDHPNNKLHIIGHSHGTKVATIAALNLQTRGAQVDHLTILDPAENNLCLDTNIANLLGYYFGKMKIDSPSHIGKRGVTFVDNYVSFFGLGLAGPAGSNINNIRQIGLESGHVFEMFDIHDRHAYAASWYSNAWAATSANGWPLMGLSWPPVTPNPSSNYFQKFNVLSSESWKKEQWDLHEGPISGAGTKTALVTNPAIAIHKKSCVGQVTGSADTELAFHFKNGYDAVPASYTGTFDARTPHLKGISFDLQWNNPRPTEYVIITVEFLPGKQQIAVVLEASAFKNTGNSNSIWHPISFNTYSTDRPTTEFTINYYPGKTWKGQYGSVRVKNFGYVKEVIE